MLLAFDCLKKILPELNENAIPPERLINVLRERHVDVVDHLGIEENGYYYISKTGKEFVILKRAMCQLLMHETLAFEFTHASLHVPVEYLKRKHQLEAEAFSLICMMPLSDLPRLNRIKHQLDAESYDLLMKRNKVNEIWGL
jgi:hypothetical protein